MTEAYVYVKEDTLNIQWLLLAVQVHVSNIGSFSFIFPHLNLHKHAGEHIVIRAICHCMQWQAAVVWG